MFARPGKFWVHFNGPSGEGFREDIDLDLAMRLLITAAREGNPLQIINSNGKVCFESMAIDFVAVVLPP